MLRHGLEHFAGKAGHNDKDGAPDGNQNTGGVKEVEEILKIDTDWVRCSQFYARDHANQADNNSANQTNDIIQVHIAAIPPLAERTPRFWFLFI